LFLDEIESIPLRAQIQLLRVLEDGFVQPLGKDTLRKVNIRLVATSKVDLQEDVRQGRIREDFYHRIMVLPISVPPLRERTEDIPVLISCFLKQAAEAEWYADPGTAGQNLDRDAQTSLARQCARIENAVERMVVTAHHGETGPFAPDERLISFPCFRCQPLPDVLRDELKRRVAGDCIGVTRE